jgi:hypothetical protein
MDYKVLAATCYCDHKHKIGDAVTVTTAFGKESAFYINDIFEKARILDTGGEVDIKKADSDPLNIPPRIVVEQDGKLHDVVYQSHGLGSPLYKAVYDFEFLIDAYRRYRVNRTIWIGFYEGFTYRWVKQEISNGDY